jgi:hypothetical protein
MSMSAAVVCLAIAALSAQAVDPAIRKAKDARSAAGLAGDEQTWARYTSDDFLMTQPNGTVQTKAQRMALIKGKRVAMPAKTSDEAIRGYGNTVVATWREDAAGGATRFTEVWIKDGTEWKAVALHATTITKP